MKRLDLPDLPQGAGLRADSFLRLRKCHHNAQDMHLSHE